MGVKEELEQLRQQKVTKTHATALASKAEGAGGRGLSTPEEEEAALRAEQERLRVGNYSKHAAQLNKQFCGAKALAGKSIPSGNLKADEKSAARADDEPSTTDDTGTNDAKGSATTPAADARDDKFNSNDGDDDDDDDDDVPDLEEQEAGFSKTIGTDEAGIEKQLEVDDSAAAPPQERQLNRAEKKARKMMHRLGMRPVGGINRVTFKTSGKGGYFAVEQPDVYEKNGTYVIFGEAVQGGGLQQQAAMQQAKAAKQLVEDDDIPTFETPGEEDGGDEAEDAVDESGVESKDVELVMSQASCSRAKAANALKENDGDLVNAIMSLTT